MICHDLAVRYHDLARNGQRQVLVVGDDNHRFAAGHELLKKIEDSMGCLLIQVASWFIGYD